MLYTLNELLAGAEAGNYAVGAFNCPHLEGIRAAVRAAEEENVPLILQYAEVHKSFINLEEIGPIMVDYAKRAKVPVAVHFDHGQSYDLFVKAIQLGFTSVMIDASALPYEENVAKTKEIVKLAHAAGVNVEAELGHVFTSTVGGGEGAQADSADDYDNLDEIYTDPDLAARFVQETGIDCLAIAFGTVHGVYFKEPQLDLDRVKRIKEAVGLPLVMHGGSGVSEEDYRVAITNGIRKINYYTYMNQAGAKSVVDLVQRMEDTGLLLFDGLSMAAMEGMKANAKAAMRIFKNQE